MDNEVARAAWAKKGSPFLAMEQAAFYLGLKPVQAPADARQGQGPGPGTPRHAPRASPTYSDSGAPGHYPDAPSGLFALLRP
jgi:hypothetical protein